MVSVAVITLAAGKGQRMRSELHKVLHPVAGRPMLLHLLASIDALAPQKRILVTGDRAEQIEQALADRSDIAFVHQARQLGTGHAVQQTRALLADFSGHILITYGDVPFVETATMRNMIAALENDPRLACVILAFRPADPAAYGRILCDAQGHIEKMVEFKDACAEERAISLCNSGLMAVRSDMLFPLLDKVGNDNASGEYYLPDIVMLARKEGHPSLVIETAPHEVIGVNSRKELAQAEGAWQDRKRTELMDAGVTLVAPESVWFSYDTQIASDVCVAPHVVFGPGVHIHRGVQIHAFSHLEGCVVEQNAQIGPHARLRPGTQIGVGARVGNFVEVKNSRLDDGAKANHLAYVGDSSVGARSNIGAGVITCNYNGFVKARTEIGHDSFIGSNSALIAPLVVGNGAVVGAGSVITRNVPDGALALSRPPQQEKRGWATWFRQLNQKKTGKTE